ncbi:exodeoxyribonuclease I [bacterium]|nr:MAG: exodeoxyribonuclease I [bacterium]
MPHQPSFFFYDLETSGTDCRRQRIMQFAGQRTTLDLEPIGEPVNWLVRLADDVLPEIEATLITGITPQSTQDGITEAELVKRLQEQVLTPDTIVTGYNNIRFDDEFIRFTLYRNFADAYAWAYKDGRSRWDLLDVVRMMRALRPQGLTWPTDDTGKPTNRLENLAQANGLDHLKAHDALSDVQALIGLARLIQQAQPKFWQYALKLRHKATVEDMIKPLSPEPFIYTNGMYGHEHDSTTAAVIIGQDRPGTYFIYDLRVDPKPFMDLSPEDLQVRLFSKSQELAATGVSRVPVKTLSTNRCPAVAPLATLTDEAASRLELDKQTIQTHWQTLRGSQLPANIAAAFQLQTPFPATDDVDGALYNGFLNDDAACNQVRTATSQTIATLAPPFTDERLPELFLRYKGRNFPQSLSDEDRSQWETYRASRIMADIEPWSTALAAAYDDADDAGKSLLTDLQLWAESIYPAEI